MNVIKYHKVQILLYMVVSLCDFAIRYSFCNKILEYSKFNQ